MGIYKKSNTGRICYGLSLAEFKCRCSYDTCTAIIISSDFLLAYPKFRRLVAMPCKINSGHRCFRHNADQPKSSKTSRHLIGEAIDIDTRLLLKKWSVEQLEKFARQAGFTFILWYDNFVHLDVREF